MLDEATDVSKKSQLSTILKYCRKGKPVERFIGFSDVTSSRTSADLFLHVKKVMNQFECGSKLVGQGYDGAAVMAGHVEGLQSLVKAEYKNAEFIHCAAHRLNLVLSQVGETNKRMHNFFPNIVRVLLILCTLI